MTQMSYEEARARKIAAEAEIAELELAKVRGSLVLAGDVVTAWSDVLANLKAKLISIPSKAAPIVASDDNAGSCQKVIEDLVREALEELSNYDPKINAAAKKRAEESSEDGNDSSQATTSSKRKRVGRPRKTAGLAE